MSELAPRVTIHTDLGQLVFTLHAKQAPHSCAYFLADVDSGLFAHTGIFRIVTEANRYPRDMASIEVVQGGEAPQDLPPSIPHETTALTGLRHRRGTISLARFRPGAVYHSFFICLRDEPALDFGGARQADGLGFAAFGDLVEGWDVLNLLRSCAEPQEKLSQIIPARVARETESVGPA